MKDAKGHGSNSGGRGFGIRHASGGGTFGIHGIGMASDAKFRGGPQLNAQGKVMTGTDRTVSDIRSNLKDGGGIRKAFMDGIRKALGR